MSHQFNRFFVCILDVLGFESRFKKIGLEGILEKYTDLISIVQKRNKSTNQIYSMNPLYREANFEEFAALTAERDVFVTTKLYGSYASDSIILFSHADFPMNRYPGVLKITDEERQNRKSDPDIGWQYNTIPCEYFLDLCNEVVCRSIEICLPLRGAISLGNAILDLDSGIYLGQPLIDAARLEHPQQCSGVSFAKEFMNQIIPKRYILAHEKHFKKEMPTPLNFSGYILDWPRHWRNTRQTSLLDTVNSLNVNHQFRDYYIKTEKIIEASNDISNLYELESDVKITKVYPQFSSPNLRAGIILMWAQDISAEKDLDDSPIHDCAKLDGNHDPDLPKEGHLGEAGAYIAPQTVLNENLEAATEEATKEIMQSEEFQHQDTVCKAEILAFLRSYNTDGPPKDATILKAIENFIVETPDAQPNEIVEALRRNVNRLCDLSNGAKERGKHDFIVHFSNSIGLIFTSLGEMLDEPVGEKFRYAAQNAYIDALCAIDKENNAYKWAEVQLNFGNLLTLQSQRSEGSAAKQFFQAAIKSFDLALQIFTKEECPLEWAKTNAALGLTYFTGGNLSPTQEERVTMYEMSIHFLRLAESIFTEAEHPINWARIQSNAGAILIEASKCVEIEIRLKLMLDAIVAQKAALRVFLEDETPNDWATVQNSLGACLLEMCSRVEGKDWSMLHAEATAACEAALRVWKSENHPYGFALATKNLKDLHAMNPSSAGT